MEQWRIDTGKIYRFDQGQNAYLFEATLLNAKNKINYYLKYQGKKERIKKITRKNIDDVMKIWDDYQDRV